MKKPKLYKGMGYSFPEQGMMAIYVPHDEYQGSKLYVLRLTAQTQPIAYVLKRLIDEAARKTWYEEWWAKFTKQEDPSVTIAKLFEKPEQENGKGGKVVTVKEKAEFDPDAKTKGGRVIRLMPKQLKKMKESQDGNNVSDN